MPGHADSYERPPSDGNLFVRWRRKPPVAYAVAVLMVITGLFRLFTFEGSRFDIAYGTFFLFWAAYVAWDAHRRSLITRTNGDRG